jgi:hypothetical protein
MARKKKKTDYYSGLAKKIALGATLGAALGAARKGKLPKRLSNASVGLGAGMGLGSLGHEISNLRNTKNTAVSKRDKRRRRWARPSTLLTGSGLPGALLSDLTY